MVLEVIAKPTNLFGVNIDWDQAMNMDVNLFNIVRKRIVSVREDEISRMKQNK